MDFDEWHRKQLDGDPDNCPHERWERRAWEAATSAERERCAKLCELIACKKYDQGTPERRAWNEATIDCAETIRIVLT